MIFDLKTRPVASLALQPNVISPDLLKLKPLPKTNTVPEFESLHKGPKRLLSQKKSKQTVFLKYVIDYINPFFQARSVY